MNREKCEHNDSNFRPEAEEDEEGLFLRGECQECGAPLLARWYNFVEFYQDEAREWQEYLRN